MTSTSVPPTRSELIERFTAPGQPFEIGEDEVRGLPMRVYTTGPRTLRDIALALGTFGDRPFLVYRDERWTYADQARIIAGLASCLRDEYGLRKGDRMAVSMRNYPEWTPLFWASALLGVVLVPLNAWWSGAELRYALGDATPRLIVADAERTALIAPHVSELQGSPALIEVRGAGQPARGVRRWEDLLASLDQAATPTDEQVGPDDDATILYTSGTTGRPKGAIGTHRNHVTNLLNTALGALVSATIANGGEPPAPDPEAPQPANRRHRRSSPTRAPATWPARTASVAACRARTSGWLIPRPARTPVRARSASCGSMVRTSSGAIGTTRKRPPRRSPTAGSTPAIWAGSPTAGSTSWTG